MIDKTIIGGVLMLAFAGAYGLAASRLSMTSSLGIGSGLFPMMMTGVLVLLGLVLIVQGVLARRRAEPEAVPEEALPPVPYRAIALITAAPIVFALLVVPFGFVPALALAVFISAWASRDTTLAGAIGVSIVMVLFCVGLFNWGLGLPLALFGPMTPFAHLRF